MITREWVLTAFGVTEEEVAELDKIMGPAERQAKTEREIYEVWMKQRMAEIEEEIQLRLAQ